jgi:hypothetical protein
MSQEPISPALLERLFSPAHDDGLTTDAISTPVNAVRNEDPGPLNPLQPVGPRCRRSAFSSQSGDYRAGLFCKLSLDSAHVDFSNLRLIVRQKICTECVGDKRRVERIADKVALQRAPTSHRHPREQSRDAVDEINLSRFWRLLQQASEGLVGFVHTPGSSV